MAITVAPLWSATRSDKYVETSQATAFGRLSATNSAEIYDPTADSWTQTNPMTSARANATAVLLQDGTALIAGGDNSGNPSNAFEIFDSSSGNFNFAGTLSSPRTKHAVAVLQDGRVLYVAISSRPKFKPSKAFVLSRFSSR